MQEANSASGNPSGVVSWLLLLELFWLEIMEFLLDFRVFIFEHLLVRAEVVLFWEIGEPELSTLWAPDNGTLIVKLLNEIYYVTVKLYSFKIFVKSFDKNIISSLFIFCF